jgi:predicted site-specific integrase-resolvase
MPSNDGPSPGAMRPRDAAKWLGISPRFLWTLTNDGVIPCVRLGSGKRQTVIYCVASLDQWLSKAESTKGGVA